MHHQSPAKPNLLHRAHLGGLQQLKPLNSPNTYWCPALSTPCASPARLPWLEVLPAHVEQGKHDSQVIQPSKQRDDVRHEVDRADDVQHGHERQAALPQASGGVLEARVCSHPLAAAVHQGRQRATTSQQAAPL